MTNNVVVRLNGIALRKGCLTKHARMDATTAPVLTEAEREARILLMQSRIDTGLTVDGKFPHADCEHAALSVEQLDKLPADELQKIENEIGIFLDTCPGDE